MTAFFTRHSALIMTALLAAVLTAAFINYTQDDVFITYVYSRNIAEGVGFVFNPGERVQGTTTPLWALLMAGVYLLTPDLLRAGNLLSGLLLFAACALGCALLRRRASTLAGLAAALLLASSPLACASFGMETLLYCALLFLAFWLWSGGRRTPAVLAAAALTWTRADGVILAGTLCLLALLTPAQAEAPPGTRLRAAVRLGLIYAAAIAPWFLFAWAYFGTPLPNTFSAKQEFLRGTAFLTSSIERWQTFYGGSPLSLLALVFIPIGLGQAWKNPALRPVAAWAVLYTAGYTALNITNFWYYTPLVAALTLLAALGGAWVVGGMNRLTGGKRTAALRTGALAIVIAAVALNTARAFELAPAPPRMNTYRLAGQWIAEHTPPDATLLLADLGVAGYYARRRTVDSFGLIVPGLADHRPENAVRQFETDLVLATRYFFWQFTEADWFRALYAPAVQVSTPGDAEFSPMTVYRLRAGWPAPPLQTTDVVWDGFAELAAVAYDRESWSGGAVRLNLEWAARGPLDDDYTLFVHLTGSGGVPLAQADGPPPLPTSRWTPGDRFSEMREIRLPPDLPAGSYHLRLGWYLPSSSRRLALQTGGDVYTLPFMVANRFPGGSGLP